MKKIEKILLAGAGAVGLTVAATIRRKDENCLSILASGERLERYRKNGLYVNGERLDAPFVQAGASGAAPVDLIIVAVKFHHLEALIAELAPFVGEDTLIVSLLNGISSEDILGRALGRRRLPLAMIISVDAVQEGGKTSFTKPGVIHFGDADGKNGEREERLAEFFARTGVAYQVEPDMRRTLWYKYMINVGTNQVSAVLRLPYAAFQTLGGPGEIPEARTLAIQAMHEVIAVANAQGIDLGPADVDAWTRTVNQLSPAGYTSMCQDVLARRKTEVELFALTMMDLGKKLSVPVPVNATLYLLLRSLEAAARAARA